MTGKKIFPTLTTEEIASLQAIRVSIEIGYKRHVTIEEHARHAGMNESKFKASFKALFGLPPFQFFRAVRMEKAKQLLSETEDSVKSIGIQVGYPDWKSFMRAFKKDYGITPSAWREKNMTRKNF